MAPDIEPLYIPTAREDLFGVYHPAEGCDLVVVMCAPFAEEKKTTYRIFHEQATALAEVGVPVLRFDYSGTGDSQGAFEESTVERWLEDIAAASEYAKGRAKATRLCLLGLRFGGALAAAARSDRLVLWQPVTDPAVYLEEGIRRQAFRQKLVDGDGGEIAGEIDGYVITDALAASVKAMDGSITHDDCLLVQVSYNEKVLAEYVPYRQMQGMQLRTVVLEPFWNRLGRIEADGLIELTTAWITAPQN